MIRVDGHRVWSRSSTIETLSKMAYCASGYYGIRVAITRCMIGISTAATPITASIHRVWVVISLRTSEISLPSSLRTSELAELLAGPMFGLCHVAEEPFLQKLEQILFLYFPPLFLLLLELVQHLHERRSRVVSQAILQWARYRHCSHDTELTIWRGAETYYLLVAEFEEMLPCELLTTARAR